MSNLPEKDDLKEINEESTIFSAPVQHKKTADGKIKKKRLLVALLSLAAVAVLVGATVAVVKFIPKREENSSTPTLEEINVINLKADTLKSVTVNNGIGEFEFYSEKTAETEDSSQSETVNWYLKGYDKDLISTSSVASTVRTASSINAIREITEKSAADCGLEKPEIKIDITDFEDNQISVLIGGESPDKSGVYLKLSSSEKIYLVSSSIKAGFIFEALDFANAVSLESITVTDEMADYKADDGSLVKFDFITISGEKITEKVVIEPNDDDSLSQYVAFMVTSPAKRIAENADIVFDAFKNGISVSGAYSFDVTKETISKLGLDKPDFMATLKIANQSLTYKFKLQPDGDFAAVSDNSKLVGRVSATTVPFVTYNTTDFYSNQVCLYAINDLKGFTFKAGDKTYDFDIEVNEEADERFIIKYNGNKLVAQNFQNFYQKCLSIYCTDYTVDKLDSEPEFSMIFKFSKDDIVSRVDFIKASPTRYQYSIDGINMGKVNSSEIKKLAKFAEQVANGGEIK